jgi:hypothetical protein
MVQKKGGWAVWIALQRASIPHSNFSQEALITFYASLPVSWFSVLP